MRNLFVAFLLAIFSFQGAVAAIGDDLVTAKSYDRAQPQVLEQLMAHAESLDDTDGAKVSSTIEELSDYVLLQVPAAHARYAVPNPSLLYVRFLSIDLPALEPPPRG